MRSEKRCASWAFLSHDDLHLVFRRAFLGKWAFARDTWLMVFPLKSINHLPMSPVFRRTFLGKWTGFIHDNLHLVFRRTLFRVGTFIAEEA